MSRLRNEDGFTLIELLVGMLIMLIVFAAVLGALETFARQSSAADSRGDNQNSARNVMDRLADGVRSVMGNGSAAAVDRAQTNDLVVRVVDPATPPVSGGANTARLMFRRYCVNSATQTLYHETLHWTTATPPALPGTACPGTGWDSTEVLSDRVTTTGGNVFAYSPSAASVAQINIDLSIDVDPNRQPGPTRLQSGISLRNVSSPPTVILTCQAVGNAQAVCDSLGTADPDGGALTYAWSSASYNTVSSTCGSFVAVPAVYDGKSQLNLPSLTVGQDYCFQLTATDPSGSSASATYQGVTIR